MIGCGPKAHKTIPIASPYPELATTSTDASYYYTNSQCRRFVVDFLAKTPTPYPNPAGHIYGRAHKLPGAVTSCSKFEDLEPGVPANEDPLLICQHLEKMNLPSNERDCGSYEKSVSYYQQPEGARQMSFVRSVTFTGSWNGKRCTLISRESKPGDFWGMAFNISRPFVGRLRVAVAVKLRGVPQQAAAGVRWWSW